MPVKQHNQPLSGIIIQIGLPGAALWPKLEKARVACGDLGRSRSRFGVDQITADLTLWGCLTMNCKSKVHGSSLSMTNCCQLERSTTWGVPLGIFVSCA